VVGERRAETCRRMQIQLRGGLCKRSYTLISHRSLPAIMPLPKRGERYLSRLRAVLKLEAGKVDDDDDDDQRCRLAQLRPRKLGRKPSESSHDRRRNIRAFTERLHTCVAGQRRKDVYVANLSFDALSIRDDHALERSLLMRLGCSDHHDPRAILTCNSHA